MKKGYTLTIGNKLYFKESDLTKKSKSIIDAFIIGLAKRKNLCEDMITRCLNDDATRKDLSYRLDAATIEKIETDKITYYKIVGKNFSESIPETEKDCIIYL